MRVLKFIARDKKSIIALSLINIITVIFLVKFM